MSEDVQQCRNCKATEETQPIYGIGDNGLCLVCEDRRQEERPSRIAERYRAVLAGRDDGTEQVSLSEVFG